MDIKVLYPTAINIIIIAQWVFGKNQLSAGLAQGPQAPYEERPKEGNLNLSEPQCLCL